MARKHTSQFKLGEAGWIAGFVRAHGARIQCRSTHFLDRATERKITFEEARAAAVSGLPIEIHNDSRGEWRVVIRTKLGICVVLSLETFTIITAYYNNPQDRHETLNMFPYRNGLSINVEQVIQNLLGQEKIR